MPKPVDPKKPKKTLASLGLKALKEKEPWFKKSIGRKVTRKNPYLNTGIEG